MNLFSFFHGGLFKRSGPRLADHEAVAQRITGVEFKSAGATDMSAAGHFRHHGRLFRARAAHDGLLHDVDLRVPAGCLLDAQPPHPVAGGNVETAQREFHKRAKLNGLAALGQYDEGMEAA